jgi:serine/threonine protein phosphatase PrpC
MGVGTINCTIAAITDVGMVRKNNEDNFMLADIVAGQNLPSWCETSHTVGENSLLLVVSDGMGGAEYGELASELTVLSIKDALMRMSRKTSPHDRVVAAVEEANHVVWQEGETRPHLKGMGATVTAALIEDDEVYIGEVGDSRAYLIRSGNIKQVTTDQSFVAQLVERGLLKPEDAVVHPRRNVILQSIGAQEIVQVAVCMFQLKKDDTLLLCSDGLSNLVTTGEMLFFSANMEPHLACQKLVDIAKQRGGTDNITCVIARFSGDALQASKDVKGLTGMLQNITTFNPEQNPEKTHKRTQLLGNSSIIERYYSGATGEAPKRQEVNHLGDFPNSEIIKDESEKLLEWLEYCQQILEFKVDQTQEAAEWLSAQNTHFTNLETLVHQIKEGAAGLSKAKEATRELVKVFTSTKKK